MSVKGYRFVSPGIFLKEVDRSVLEAARPERGPLLVGRFRQGPGMRPVTVTSYSEFVRIFGAPHPGGAASDAWRGPAHGGPTYAAYAAEAWLNAGVSPPTILRLLGEQSIGASTAGNAGWETKNSSGTVVSHVTPTGASTGNASVLSTNGGAYGLWMWPSGSQGTLNDSTAVPAIPPAGGSDSASEVPHAYDNAAVPQLTGSLAAVWYLTEGAIVLEGKGTDGSTAASGSAWMGRSSVESGDLKNTFTARIFDSAGDSNVYKFNFDPDSEHYIRRVFNTDPARTSNDVYGSDRATYWLGESFEQEILHNVNMYSGSAWSGIEGVVDLSSADIHDRCVKGVAQYYNKPGGQMGMLLGLGNSNAEWQMHREDWADGRTGWFIAQDTGTATDFNAENAQKLFRLIGRNHGEWLQNNMKVSIENILPSNNTKYRYGSFDVVLRRLGSKDDANGAVEVFAGCNLDIDSVNYVGRRIGDKYEEWDSTNERMRTYGTYDNMSDFVRIEIDDSVKNGALAQELVPWGVFGPPVMKGVAIRGGKSLAFKAISDGTTNFGNAFVEGSGSIPYISHDLIDINKDSDPTDVPRATQPEVSIGGSPTDNRFDIRFPRPKLVLCADTGDTGRHSHLGVDWCKADDASRDLPAMGNLEPSLRDCLRRLPEYYAANMDDPHANDMEYSWVFTLDDVQLEFEAGSTGALEYQAKAYYVSGSRQMSTTADPGHRPSHNFCSWSAASGALDGTEGLHLFGYNQFTTVFHGGHDGLDVQEVEPFRNTYLDDASGDKTVNYAYNTVFRALQTVQDPEYVEYNILSVPGLTEPNLTKKVVQVCEDRADALGVIDVNGGFQPRHESSASPSARRGSIKTIASNMKSRELDSSYGAAYYPWAQVRDNRSGRRLWVPPSVIGVGVLGNSQAKSEIWFAPAGFIRGGLSSQGTRPGAAGLKVLNVHERLTSSDRDTLYDQSINPIAKFPSEGLVVFGQKTLQLVPSALDRINVRRLLLYVKKEISIIAAQTIFQPNVQVTWDSFKSKADRFLADVQARFGLTDYLVKLMDDPTPSPSGVGTVTDDLVDRNVMYAQIYLKPAKAIEFIAIDFIITKSGASFTD